MGGGGNRRKAWASAIVLAAALATVPPVLADPRRDLADFDFVTRKVAANYSGWPNKTAGARAAELEALTRELRRRVETGGEPALREALDAWLGWFDDGHLGSRWTAVAEDSPWREPPRALDEAAARARWQAPGAIPAPVEGLWTIDEAYRLAIVRRDGAPGVFDAVVLASTAETWAPGDVKAVLTARADGRFDLRYGARDRSELRLRAELQAGDTVLDLGDLGLWRRVLDGADARARALRRWPGDAFELTRLDARTLYLRLPSFNGTHAATVRELLATHADALARTPRLVLDVRGNGGGSDFVYEPMLPVLASGPIRRVGVEIRVSADNARLRAEVADRLAAVSPDAAATLRAESARMRDARTAFIRREPAERSLAFDPAPMPRRVAVLVDRAGSSAENFLLDVRQSDKVVLMGQENSAGVIDYGEMMEMPAPSGRFDLRWATTRSLRLPAEPVDPHGITPDVRIPADVADPIAYVLDWLDREDAARAAPAPAR